MGGDGGAGLIAAPFAWGTVLVEGAARPAALIDGEAVTLLDGVASLAELVARGPAGWAEARERAAGAARLPLAAVEPLLPLAPRDLVDFSASREHAERVGRRLRPGQPLAASWYAAPSGYHGRAGSVVVSGTPVARPSGPRGDGDAGPTRRLDFECELGLVAGPGTRPGEFVPVAEGEAHVFGVVLLNDWSARDLQAAETVPLGPFLGKSFLTSISPWLVPLDLVPRAAGRTQDPPPLPYLRDPAPRALDVPLTVTVNGEEVTRTNARDLWWTPAQLLAHATVNGARLTPGDLFGTGTVSGPTPGSEGCLLERDGDVRWLADGDEVVLASPLLGEVRGRIGAGRGAGV